MQGIDINQVITLVQELKYLIRKIEGTEDESGILSSLDRLILNDLPSVLEEHQVFDDRGIRTLEALNQILVKFEKINENVDASFEVLGTTIKREHKIVLQNIASISKTALEGLQNIESGIKGISKNLDLTPVNEAIKLSIGEAFKAQINLLKNSSEELQKIQATVQTVTSTNKKVVQEFSEMQGEFSEMIKGFNKKALIGVGGACLAVGIGLGIAGGIYIAEPFIKKVSTKELEEAKLAFEISKDHYQKKVLELEKEYKDASQLEKLLRGNAMISRLREANGNIIEKAVILKKSKILAEGLTANDDKYFGFAEN